MYMYISCPWAIPIDSLSLYTFQGQAHSQYYASANLRTKILDFRGFDSSRILVLRGGILMSIGEIPSNCESTNLSRDNLSREIGRICCMTCFSVADCR